MSRGTTDPAARPGTGQDGPRTIDAGPLGELPWLSRRQVQLEARLGRVAARAEVTSALAWLVEAIGASVRFDQPEVVWRASGLQRPGVMAQLSWPRLASRLGLGIENPVAHAVVDRLLGYERLPEEGRLQVTPVEWGILTFAVAETLARLEEKPGALGPWDLTLDRVGPDPFNPAGLGSVVTFIWTVRIGSTAGVVRLWVPEALVALWLITEPPPEPGLLPAAESIRERQGDLTSVWRAIAGTVQMPRGLGRLRLGGVLPIDEARLRGTPQSPAGPIELTLDTGDFRYVLGAEAQPGTGGGRVILNAPLRLVRTSREAVPVSASPEPSAAPATGPEIAPTDVPVTLTLELGRISLPLRRLADLRPGDVLELGRHAREPVELTSGGRLVARGELVQIDTELGVRVTAVFL